MIEPEDDPHDTVRNTVRRNGPLRDEFQERAAAARAKARASARRGVGHHLKWILINIAWIIAVAWLYAHFLVPRLTSYLDRGP